MLVHRQDVERIAVLTLNNPPANGYSYAMHRELDAHVCDLRMDTGIDVVVIRGAGDKFFCAGADIGYLQSLDPSTKYYFCLHANETLLRLENTPKLVIAALNGHCVGGGLEIALACDIRIGMASGDKPRLVGLPEVSLGVLPGTGGTQRLTRVLGRSRALQLMVEGRNMPVEEAEELGLVNFVLPQADWWGRVMAYARSFCAPERAPGAVGLIKRAVVAGADLPLESGLALERELQQRLFTSPDAAEGLAAFVGKRKPSFGGFPTSPKVPAPAAAPPTAPAKPAPVATAPAPSPAVSPSSPDTAVAVKPVAPDVDRPITGEKGSVFEDEPVPSEEYEAAPPDVDLLRIRIAEEILNLLPTWMVRQYLVIPLRKEGNTLVVAIDDPTKEGAMAAVRDHTGLEVRAVRAERDALIARYTMHYRL